MFRQGQDRLYHVQVMDLLGIHLAQAFGKEVGLLLVIAFDVHLVERLDDRLQQSNRILLVNDFALFDKGSSCFHPFLGILFQGIPFSPCAFELHTVLSFRDFKSSI